MGLAEILQKRLAGGQTMGFGALGAEKGTGEDLLTALVDYGLIPEYVNRLTGVFVLPDPTRLSLMRMAAGRHGITVCECAGWGDVGFVNIWTYEITNKLSDSIWLPVGAIIAQVAFSEVEVPTSEYAAKGGHTYVLDTLDPEEIRRKWTPENMLPKALKVRGKWKEQTWKKN